MGGGRPLLWVLVWGWVGGSCLPPPSCHFAECFQGHFCLVFPLLKLQPWLLPGPSLLLPPRPQLWGRAQSIAPAAVPRALSYFPTLPRHRWAL